jgi:hypothetical protein
VLVPLGLCSVQDAPWVFSSLDVWMHVGIVSLSYYDFPFLLTRAHGVKGYVVIRPPGRWSTCMQQYMYPLPGEIRQ